MGSSTSQCCCGSMPPGDDSAVVGMGSRLAVGVFGGTHPQILGLQTRDQNPSNEYEGWRGAEKPGCPVTDAADDAYPNRWLH